MLFHIVLLMAYFIWCVLCYSIDNTFVFLWYCRLFAKQRSVIEKEYAQVGVCCDVVLQNDQKVLIYKANFSSPVAFQNCLGLAFSTLLKTNAVF